MRSSEIAQLAGVSVRTLRHYHSIGLLPEPPRHENGYREYDYSDLARLLRIKRLASLGFSLARIEEMLDASRTPDTVASTNESLDELDRELAASIAQLEEKRQTVAFLKRENLDPDLPIRFTRTLRELWGGETSLRAQPEKERMLVQLAGNLYDEKGLQEFEYIVDSLKEQELLNTVRELDQMVADLPADASEEDRERLAGLAVEIFEPIMSTIDPAEWNRPYTQSERLLLDLQEATNNDAQNDVYDRIYQLLEERFATRNAQSSRA